MIADGRADFYALVFDLALWMADAACRGMDPDVFHPVRGGSRDAAFLACKGCPVKAECFDYAMENRIEIGIWGGTSAKQRGRLRFAWESQHVRIRPKAG